MKQLLAVAFIILVLCGVVYVWMEHYGRQDHGQLIGMALGNPSGSEVELHVVISIGMTRMAVTDSQQRLSPARLDWIPAHFDLRDSAGKAVTFSREGHSNLITDQQACNPEFFIRARLKANETHTFDYIPVAGESKRYRHRFTVPAQGQPFERAQFDLVAGS